MPRTTKQEPNEERASTEQPAEQPQQAEQDGTAQQLQAQVNQEQEQGFRGVEVDPTPNEAYTIRGVTSGQPTPETDAGAAREARRATGGPVNAVERRAINEERQAQQRQERDAAKQQREQERDQRKAERDAAKAERQANKPAEEDQA